MKILVADNDATSRVLLTRFLGASGHQVVLANDGLQALDMFQREDPPAVAILDLAMPGMSGIDLCRQLRQPDKQSPYILLLSPSGALADLGDAFDAGVDDYLQKPVDLGAVKARLRIAARVMELEERVERALNPETERDSLTGIWNRLTILEFLRAQFSRSTRNGISTAVILGDMDRFYEANEKFGRAACDAVLRETAKRLGGSLRPYDSLGRYGGEEFLIIVPDCTMSNAYALADRLRLKIADEPFLANNKQIYASISFGVATTAETGAQDEEGLLRSADSALYLAKEHGRNCVETAKRIVRQRPAQSRFLPVTRAKELVQ